MTTRISTLSTTALLFACCAGSLSAAGLDRSFQSITSIFDDSRTVTFSYGHVRPSLSGTDNSGTGTGSYSDVGDSYGRPGISYTQEFGEKFSFSVIYDRPFGANVSYDVSPLTSNLGGTGADLGSQALTFVGRYRFNERFSLFGGVKVQQIDADVQLNGLAYAGAISTAAVARQAGVNSRTLGAALLGDPNAVAALGGPATVSALGAQVTTLSGNFLATGGYDVRIEDDERVGYLIGGAYEIPDIALRLSVAYHFEFEHTNSTTENLFGTTTASELTFKSPQSLNVDFQTGIAENTLLTASYRWTDFESVDVIPTVLDRDLVNLPNGHRWTLGVARRFSERFAGSATLSFEPTTNDDLVSPLGPSEGLWGISLGGRYEQGNMTISGGVNYSWLGDVQPEVGNRPVASFTDNTSLAVGLQAKFTF